jgi:hypothetical protein
MLRNWDVLVEIGLEGCWFDHVVRGEGRRGGDWPGDAR